MIRSRGIVTIEGIYDEDVVLNSDDCGCAYQTDGDPKACCVLLELLPCGLQVFAVTSSGPEDSEQAIDN